MNEDAEGLEALRPTINNRVFYFAYGTPGGEYPAAVPRAATITEVGKYDPTHPDSNVGLVVFNPTGLFFNRNVPYGPGKPGHWGWHQDGNL